MQAKLYLTVPYAQKEQAKALGAKWYARIKKWYYDGEVKNFEKFGQWILGEDEECIIVYENLCIIEGKRTCYKCQKETRVIGFGIHEHSKLSYDSEYLIDDPEDTPGMEDYIFLTWADDESDVPPLLLRYIKKHYNVKTGFSRQAGKCFANHCDHCGYIQGNNYLFHKLDSPLATSVLTEPELIDQMSRLKIHNIYTDAALVLNCDRPYCSQDWAYAVYCKQFDDVALSEIDNELFTDYGEMYECMI